MYPKLGVIYAPEGVKVPDWDLDSDLAFNKTIGVRASILSAPMLGFESVAKPEDTGVAARSMNEYGAAVRDKDPSSYGLFATVPPLEYTEVAIREIQYAYDTLHADGVILFTRYGTGDGYLGNEEYVPIWEELNARHAVVFVHPTSAKNPHSFNEKLPSPAFDWPHETARTAMDLILNGRLKQFPNVKIILSHAGGTLPILAHRATMVAYPEFGATITAKDIIDQAKSFYFDLAQAGSSEVLPLILGFAKKGHVLFGSDYPYVPNELAEDYTRFIDEYELDDESRKEIYYGAAEKLFPRLAGKIQP